jgi:predicted Zn-dependent peptidase
MSFAATLENGLRVVTRPMPGVETASVGLFADCGSRHEPAQLNGLAHLYEHMVFKGAGGRSAREISEAIEDVGGELNACTDRDATSFTSAVIGEHVPLAVELLASMILRPHFAAEELEREKDVVLQELAEAEDTPSDIIFDELWSAAFADQPLGRPVLGSEASIGRITVEDLHGWRTERYRGADLILAAAGKVDHEDVVALAEQHLSDLPSGSAAAETVAARFTGGRRVGRTPSEQAQITFGFEGPAELDPDYYAARLFADAVGGGASSRLFQELREERGLAYAVSATLHPYSDTGIFYVHAATSRDEAAAAAQLIEEILDTAARDLSQRELDRMRTRARAGLLMHLETPWGQASYAARQLAVHGRVVEPHEVVAKLDAVTLDQARVAGAKMLAGARARATIGVRAVRAA